MTTRPQSTIQVAGANLVAAGAVQSAAIVISVLESGPVQQIRTSKRVREVYLGTG